MPLYVGDVEKLTISSQGVGESLRGTLNNEIDTRFPRKNPEKAAAANAKNQAAINTGNTEIQGLNYRRS